MGAAAWTAIAALAGALFGSIFWLGSRIDGPAGSLGACIDALSGSSGGRIDALDSRVDAQNARIDRLGERVAGLTVELRTHLRAHPSSPPGSRRQQTSLRCDDNAGEAP